QAFAANVKKEFERNGERYRFLAWGQQAFENFRLVPPGTGICHQVNLEYLSQVVWTTDEDGKMIAYPDTLVGTDSHTTMVNGLAVLGWGVGGIEAEAAMLGQPISMLIPEVVGVRLTGKLAEGATATDLVLGSVEPSLAGPRRPQDRVSLSGAGTGFDAELPRLAGVSAPRTQKVEGTNYDLHDGDVVIAAITSCTNTSNPSVMLGAGLL